MTRSNLRSENDPWYNRHYWICSLKLDRLQGTDTRLHTYVT